MSSTFPITRIFAGEDGESHFGTATVDLSDRGEIGLLSEPVPTRGIVFRENDEHYDYDWHPAPQRQYIVLLDGAIEIEVGDGEVRQFRGGEVLLVEDTSGQGHRTRTLGGTRRRSIFVLAD